ncbi:MAG: hypothetical protein LBU09_00975 [Endomicrobium sp.]|jgi:hypothetical protein|nr:hypothetical protein [Endomicrobium sp.]
MAGENLVYDYALKINIVGGVPAQNLSFLKTPLVVVKPKSGFSDTGVIIDITSPSQIAAITDNANVVKLFDAGIAKILMIAIDTDLTTLDALFASRVNDFFTILISDDFTDAQKAAASIGALFKGVVGFSSDELSFALANAQVAGRSLYYSDEANMFYAFGKLLSQVSWTNLQYETLLNDDEIIDASTAESLFNARASFSLKDAAQANRLSFFVQGGEAIIAPYVLKEIELRLQDETVNWIALNKPNYDEADCSILAQYLTEKVLSPYIAARTIASGRVQITTQGGQNFIANGTISIPKPTALWRVQANLYNA